MFLCDVFLQSGIHQSLFKIPPELSQPMAKCAAFRRAQRENGTLVKVWRLQKSTLLLQHCATMKILRRAALATRIPFIYSEIASLFF